MQITDTMDANKIRIPDIKFDSPITDLIMELEQLRYKQLQGTTHPLVFMQLKQIFHMLESIGSSRIEGNNTTVLDYVESTKLSKEPYNKVQEDIKEIINIERAMQYLEENIDSRPLSTLLIRELHSIVVEELSTNKEGASHPGQFRSSNVRISGSKHVSPESFEVERCIQELIDFINQKNPPKYDLLKIAIAHHRFVWIHPFENGNGRVVRLFTYAMLLKNVFKDKNRIINPTAVFCSDRQSYYDKLAEADKGTDEGLLTWCQYMLDGLKSEIVKIDKLCDYSTLKDQILLPSISDAITKKYITQEQALVLKHAINKKDQILQSSDLKIAFPNKNSSDLSRLIRSLKDSGMLLPTHKGARKYVISFSNSYLLRSILKALDENSFLPKR